jgi:arsenate reductase (thioredoxin)
VLCKGNSFRSQVAEGYLRFFANDKAEIYSAGIETYRANPKPTAILLEDSLDILKHISTI